ncbi:MAG: diaminopimelate epimerase, partial [Gammaproteobacteria bacterium]|nr:diaminopimelate epimerase [Gammaproteobacteria bacterium]
ADGGEVEQCGNGARCIAVYLREHGFPDQPVITAETKKELLQLTFTPDGEVRVNMGLPDFSPLAIPLAVEVGADEYSLETSLGKIVFNALSMGNPHAVLLVDDVDQARVSTLGPEIQQNAMFPEGVNVGFMQIMNANAIRLRVYERGAGETLACGSGACAAVVAGQRYHGLSTSVDVSLKGGSLNISRESEGQAVWMTGPAETVFTGEISL